MKRSTKAGILILSLSIAGLFFAHTHFCYNTLYKPARLFSEAVKQKPFDAVIVPGIPYDAGKWGFVMKWRVYWSVFLYKTGMTKNVIYSGGAVYTPYTEAMIMAMYGEKLGIPQEHIFVESKAEHTTENLYYSWQLAKEKGFQKIAFATDPFQSLQIEPYIHSFNVDVKLIPSVIYFMEHIPFKDDPEIDAYKAYKLDFKSIHERETEEEQKMYSKGGRIYKLIRDLETR
jgi:uncharacterized SAM-binding protein YcdF (DUF218 family)